MIQLQRVSKSFGDKTVFSAFSHIFAPGQTHVILGSSGCGKSTLLKIILGLILPDEGWVIIEGQKRQSPMEPTDLHKIGYVVQNGGLFPHLTALKNIMLPARSLNWDEKRITSRVKQLAQLTDFEPGLLSKYPRELSGGQSQRVGLMRALMLDPPILLMDEPLGALDPIIRAELQYQLKNMFRSLGKTVIFVTHDLKEAAFLSDSIILMEKGKIEQSGKFSDLLKNPATAFVTRFVNAQRLTHD